LLRYETNNFSRMSAGELAGFKRGTHKNDFEVVKQKAKYNDINLSNLSMVLYAIYMELPVSDIKDCSFKLLDILIQNNPNFGNKGKLGNIAIKNLKDIYDKVMSENNQLSEIIPDTNLNTNSNIGQQLANNQGLIEKTLKTIKTLYKRLHLKQISIKVFQFHQQNGTVPQKLNIQHFPPPFLPHCIIFVDIHNRLVKECQTKMMNACVERLNEQISKIRDNITSNKNKIKDMTEDIDEKLNQISDDVENSLKPSLEKALDKARRITIREFVVKSNENDENVSIDEDWFVSESNNNNSNSNTHQSDNRQNEIRSRNSSNDSRPHNFSHQSRSRNSSFSINNDNRSRSNYWNNNNNNNNYNNNNDRYKYNNRQRNDNRNSNNSGHRSRNNYNNNNYNWRNSDRNSSSSNRNQRNYASFNRSSSKNRHASRNHSRFRNNNQ
jgi:hypothetical protein